MLVIVRDLSQRILNTWVEKMDRRLLSVAQTGSVDALLRPSIFQIVALLLTLLVYSFVIYLSIFAINNLIVQSTILMQVVAGSLLAFLAWSTWPRFMQFPPPQVIADPIEFPELNRLVADVSQRLSVATPVLVLTEQFDAAFGRIGVRRRPVLILGNPLIATLSEKELIAVIAHEIGHARDGAITRTLFVRMAHGVIKRWSKLHCSTTTFKSSALTVIARILTFPLYIVLSATDWLFQFCAARDAKRAEYVADAHSLSLAGSIDSHQLSMRFLYGSLPEVKAAYSEAIPERRFRALHEAVSALTPGEKTWLNNTVQKKGNELLSLHPPTCDRNMFAAAFTPTKDQFSLEDNQFELIQEEIERWPIVIHKRELALETLDTEQVTNENVGSNAKDARKLA